jgi:hypothetical protein
MFGTRFNSRAMLGATIPTIVLLTTACSDSAGPSSESHASPASPGAHSPSAPVDLHGNTPPSPPDTTPRKGVAMAAAVASGLPAHQSVMSCYQQQVTGAPVVVASLGVFNAQPGTSQFIIGPGGGPTTYEPEWLYFGVDVAWHDGRQWQYSGASYNQDHSWIAAPAGGFFGISALVWFGGKWTPLSFVQRAHAGQALAFPPRGVRVWARARYVWEAWGNLPRLSDIRPWEEVTCSSGTF